MEAYKARKAAFLSGEIYAGDILEMKLTNERERGRIGYGLRLPA